ncbi:vWA domain-containing protein [Pseudotenacibaculum sp. MALMAid0570]|uniref:vWA domain-containing protein n=1 Tax=Pseudotenacibaculum sp. MALMAid0570 TaxID=3143938 RepID=UPI0032DEBFC1
MRTRMLKVITVFLLGISVASYATNDPKNDKKKKQTIKVALLLDTSNSMDGLINQAKAQLWEIVNELSYAKYGIKKPDLEIALYEYGNDRLESSDGYIRQVLTFSSDLDEISEKLFSLTTNGGQEYCGQVIDSSLKGLKWGKNKNDLRLIFIAGNEPFTQGKINYKEAIADAKEKDVIINTIYCGDYNTGISGMWQDGAELGGGDYMTINHNKKIVHIVTPYDDQIIILNKKLNKTYIYFGSKGRSKYANQAIQDTNAEKLAAPVSVKRAVSKSNRLYNNSAWDLVDRSEKEEVDYSKVKRNQLPKELQKMSDAELKKYVEKQKKIRSEIKTKINELNKKRRAFIAQKQKESSKKNELESVMIKAIKKQAMRKNYSW